MLGPKSKFNDYVWKIYKTIFLISLLISLNYIKSIGQSRYLPINISAFGPWYGSGCPDNGKCGCGGASNLAEEFECQVAMLKKYDIPITAYLFDGNAWSKGSSWATNTCIGDSCCSWKLGKQTISILKENKIKAILHFWGGCHAPYQYQRAYDELGESLMGFYLDDGSSTAEAKGAIDFMAQVSPGNSGSILKPFSGRAPFTTFEGLAKYGNICYVGDLTYNFKGMQNGIKRLFKVSELIPAPFNEFTSYAYGLDSIPDEESYIRRLHYGCFQVVMANTPYANSDPWLPSFSPKLLELYRYYSWFHKELTPYLYSYAYNMYENPNESVFRNADSLQYSVMLGNEIFVKYITTYCKSTSFELPKGSWIDYNSGSEYKGTVSKLPVPLGHEPIFIRKGAIIPLCVERNYTGHGTEASKDAITLLIYLADSGKFKYRDQQSNSWYNFTYTRNAESINFTVDKITSEPLILRFMWFDKKPKGLKATEKGVLVSIKNEMEQKNKENEVNAATTNSWFYNNNYKTLIVKLIK